MGEKKRVTFGLAGWDEPGTVHISIRYRFLQRCQNEPYSAPSSAFRC